MSGVNSQVINSINRTLAQYMNWTEITEELGGVFGRETPDHPETKVPEYHNDLNLIRSVLLKLMRDKELKRAWILQLTSVMSPNKPVTSIYPSELGNYMTISPEILALTIWKALTIETTED